MRISVALCSYNGAEYLSEQLSSIGTQTRLPDELIISDDNSTDSTLEIAREFARSANFRVVVQVNPSNLGSTANFSKAIEECTGDLIFLSDQDDVWRENKIERMESVFLSRPKSALVFSDAEIVDVSMRPLGYSLWESIGFGRSEQNRFKKGETFECLMKRYRVTGAATAFRSNLRGLLLPIPQRWLHDAWISILTAATAEVVPLDEKLILYRQHPKQQIGGRRMSLLAEYRVAAAANSEKFSIELDNFTELFRRLSAQPNNEERLELLSRKIAHIRRRLQMRESSWRLPSVTAELVSGNYFRFSRGWKAVAQDLFLN